MNDLSFTDWMERTAALGEVFDKHAEESEAAGTLSPAAVDALCESGLLNVAVPRELGGSGMSATQTMTIIEELSRAHASAGWCAMINIATAGVCSAFLSEEGARELFLGQQMPVLAQNRQPTGIARRVDGGYEIEGRFGFGSGSAYSTWLGAGAVLLDESGEKTDVKINFLVPASACELDDNWQVVGLKATASVDFVVPRQFVPDHLTWMGTATARRGTGLFRAVANGNGMVVACAGHTPVVLGLAYRALQEICVIASRRRRLKAAGTIADDPLFLDNLARRDAALRSARAYLYETTDAIDSASIDWDSPAGDELCFRIRQAAIHAHDVAEEAIRFACTWAGSAALRTPNLLARALTDIAAARCHILVEPTAMAATGRVLATSLPDSQGAYDFGQLVRPALLLR